MVALEEKSGITKVIRINRLETPNVVHYFVPIHLVDVEDILQDN